MSLPLRYGKVVLQQVGPVFATEPSFRISRLCVTLVGIRLSFHCPYLLPEIGMIIIICLEEWNRTGPGEFTGLDIRGKTVSRPF